MNIYIFQPALAAYRLDFFRRLATHYGDSIHVYYSPVRMGALTARRQLEAWEKTIGPMRYPIRGIEWQEGALTVPFRKGDLVVVCGAPRTLSTLFVLLKARLKGARSIWWGHYWSSTSKTWRHSIRMHLTHLADALLFYTDAEVARFNSDGWRHRGLVGALNNGIDLSKVAKLRQHYEPFKRRSNFLFIGRLTKKASLGLLIEAMSDKALSDVHLHVIGDGEEDIRLSGQADVLGVAARITWYGGTTDELRIAEITNRCAGFVYPGPVGLSLIHAMGYGLPCIVHSDTLRQGPEIAAFEEGRTGRSFKNGSVKSLVSAISGLLSDPEGRVKMAARCIEVTRDNYTTESMAVRFAEFVKSIAPREITE